MNNKEKLSKELALKLADNLLANEPRHKDSGLAKFAVTMKNCHDEWRPVQYECVPLCFDNFRDLIGMVKTHKSYNSR